MKGFDCNRKLSYDMACKFIEQGYNFVIRYVGRLQKSPAIDIDSGETDNILRAGLKLAIVQHCPPSPGIIPSKELGTTYGKNAALFAEEARYKKGCIIYLDLEDVKAGSSQPNILDYCNYWYTAVNEAGYVPGIYVGANTWLTGDELYHKLKFQHYWKSLSASTPIVSVRGYEMVQSAGGMLNEIQIDNDTVVSDNKGNNPVFMEPEITQRKN